MPSSSNLEIRPMGDEDIPAVFSLIDKEKWGWELNEIRRIHRLDPNSSMIAFEDGQLVGLVTVINYGAFAFIVHAIVTESLRGKGAGRRIMDAALDRLDRAGVSNTELHAMPDSLDFYAHFGFEPIEDVSFFIRDTAAEIPDRIFSTALGDDLSWLPREDIEVMADLESKALGYDRVECLRALSIAPPDFALASLRRGEVRGMLMARSGIDLNSLGMWVLDGPDIDSAERMMLAVISAMDGKPFHACVPTSNGISGQVLRKCGFSLLKDDITRMSRSIHEVSPFSDNVLSIPDFEII